MIVDSHVYIVLVAEFFDCIEGIDRRLRHECFDPDFSSELKYLPAAGHIARDIVDNCAPVSVALTKAMLWQFMFETNIDKIDRINSLYFAWSGQQPDSKEGVTSFLEKRDPEWKMSVPKDLPDFFPLD